MDLASFLRYLPYLHETSSKWPPDPPYCRSGDQQKRKVKSIALFPKTYTVSIEPHYASESVGSCYFRCTSSADAAIRGAADSLFPSLEAIVFLPDFDTSSAGEWGIIASPSGSTTTAGTASASSPSSESTKPPHFLRNELQNVSSFTTRSAMSRSSHNNRNVSEGEEAALYFRFNNQFVFYVDYSQIKSVEFNKAQQNSPPSIDSLLIAFDCCYFHVYNYESPESSSSNNQAALNNFASNLDPLVFASGLLQKYLLGRRCKVPWENLVYNYPLNIGSVDSSSEFAEPGGTSDPSSNEPGQQQETTDHTMGQPASQTSALSCLGSEGSASTTVEKDKSICNNAEAVATVAVTAVSTEDADSNKIFLNAYDIPLEKLFALPEGAKSVLNVADLLLPLFVKKRRQQMEQNRDAVDSIIRMAQERLPMQNNYSDTITDTSNKSTVAAQQFSVLEKNSVIGRWQQDDVMVFEENCERTHKKLKEDIDKCFTQLFPPSRVRLSQQAAATALPQQDPSEVVHNAKRLIQMFKVSTASRHLFAMDYCNLNH
jgi:hypothetical protein